jgi:eukaryotic-like serine/threonine-protein kinase
VTPDGLQVALVDRYRLERELGRGGMATVYLAQDLRHDRLVAVKVLRPELAAVIGAERFLAEIKTTAHLQHPHILPLFDSGQADTFLFYVMPFVEGESLRDRLTREKQLPIADAVRITTEVASALDYAHRHGVIHRDIKPENILLHDGQALVADFGIALAASRAGGTRMTETGLSLGTPQYMSPEQATAERELDARSDVYALGATTYEMLTGEPPFTGATTQAIIAKLMTESPRPLSVLRPTVSLPLEAAVLTALQKLPADRWPSAAAFADALAGRTPSSVLVAARPADPRRSRAVRNAALGVLWLLSLVAAVAMARKYLVAAAGDSSVRQWNIALPDSAPVALTGPTPFGIWQRAVAISHQGNVVAYVAPKGQTTQLAIRRLDQLEVRVIPGTEGAYNPFFSPDGRWIGFFTGEELKKVPVDGGSPIALASGLVVSVGADWIDGDSILVANFEGALPVWVPSSGGTPHPAATDSISRNLQPSILAGRHYVIGAAVGGLLVARSLETGKSFMVTGRGLVPRDSTDAAERIRGASPRYLPGGYLLSTMPGDGVLGAMPFDLVGMMPLGPAMPVVTGVRQEVSYGTGQYDIADDGTLVYIPGHNAELGVLAWTWQGGRLDTLPFPRSGYFGLLLSPDGAHAMVRRLLAAGNLYESLLIDLVRHQESRPWDDRIAKSVAIWMDNERVYRCCGPDSVPEAYDVATGTSRPLPKPRHEVRAISPDGRWWFSWRLNPKELSGDGFLEAAGDTATAPLPIGPGSWASSFSPDSRWLAVTALLRGGKRSIAVVPVPFDGRRFEIATDGEQPLWFPDGRRIVYRRGGQFMVVEVDTRNGHFVVSAPRPLPFGPSLRVPGWAYGLAPDGRLLVIAGPGETTADHLNVITNFGSMVERTVRAGGAAKP